MTTWDQGKLQVCDGTLAETHTSECLNKRFETLVVNFDLIPKGAMLAWLKFYLTSNRYQIRGLCSSSTEERVRSPNRGRSCIQSLQLSRDSTNTKSAK